MDLGRPWTLLCYRKPLILTETDVCRVSLKMNKKNRQLFLLMVSRILFREFFHQLLKAELKHTKNAGHLMNRSCETCIKCFAVHTFKFEIFQTTEKKNETKNIRSYDWSINRSKVRIWGFLLRFFMISNLKMCTPESILWCFFSFSNIDWPQLWQIGSIAQQVIWGFIFIWM